MQQKEGTTWGHVRFILDERAVAVVFVRKQMGKMRKTEVVAHTFNLDIGKQLLGQTGLTASDEHTCSRGCW